jgi:hypothetical protein
MAALMQLSLCEESIAYEAIFRHVEHLSQNDWQGTDTVLAARMAEKLFPILGYPVPGWITDLAAIDR